MHVAHRMRLPERYVARPYRGTSDHPAIAAILGAYREFHGDPQLPTVEQIDVGYAHLDDCDPETDIYVVECADEPVGYGRTSHEDLIAGTRDCVVFAPTLPQHLDAALFTAIVEAQEAHMRPLADEVPEGTARLRAYAGHPGPDEAPVGEARWLEDLGYEATEWGASLVRPHLDDIAELPLPDGVEVRPVTEDQIRPILEAHVEAFRGEWDYHEPSEDEFAEMIEEPTRDESLWKIAWAGDEVVGQVKSFIHHEENAQRGYLRGYTEEISTHRDWRNKGIAGALIAMSLRELRERGMTEAALGVDTNNPGGAFHLYQRLGFELRSFEAVYTKPFT